MTLPSWLSDLKNRQLIQLFQAFLPARLPAAMRALT
jgi:hypothetical protein